MTKPKEIKLSKAQAEHVNKFIRAKEAWRRKHRPSIVLLLESGEDFHDTALLQMIPCMEMVFALENPTKSSTNVSLAAVVKRFFPFWDEQQCELFRKHVANGLKHDSFIRPHSVTVTSSRKDEDRPFLPTTMALTFEHPEFGEATTLFIDKVSFWRTLHPQIDSFYDSFPLKIVIKPRE